MAESCCSSRLASRSVPDAARIAALLAEIDRDELAAIGFTAEEARIALGGQQGQGGIEVFEIDADPVADQFWIIVRGPLADQARVLARIKTLMAEEKRVEIDIGTSQL